jgi:hypothetical protein
LIFSFIDTLLALHDIKREVYGHIISRYNEKPGESTAGSAAVLCPVAKGDAENSRLQLISIYSEAPLDNSEGELTVGQYGEPTVMLTFNNSSMDTEIETQM